MDTNLFIRYLVNDDPEKMNKLPGKIRKRLQKEARSWDASIAQKKPEESAQVLEQSVIFKAYRPTRQPVSLRMDPFDLSMAKRIAR